MAHMSNKKRRIKTINDLKRAYSPFNTGERVMKSNKDYNRRTNKVDLRTI